MNEQYEDSRNRITYDENWQSVSEPEYPVLFDENKAAENNPVDGAEAFKPPKKRARTISCF